MKPKDELLELFKNAKQGPKGRILCNKDTAETLIEMGADPKYIDIRVEDTNEPPERS